MSTDVLERRSPENATIRKPAPRYKVLLHNDDYNSMEYVVQSLMQTVAGMTQPQAVDIMMEALRRRLWFTSTHWLICMILTRMFFVMH
jgi:ATP-dependent Clp protease adaptor protein ClpS